MEFGKDISKTVFLNEYEHVTIADVSSMVICLLNNGTHLHNMNARYPTFLKHTHTHTVGSN